MNILFYCRLEGLMDTRVLINRLQSVISANEQILNAARASRYVLNLKIIISLYRGLHKKFNQQTCSIFCRIINISSIELYFVSKISESVINQMNPPPKKNQKKTNLVYKFTIFKLNNFRWIWDMNLIF